MEEYPKYIVMHAESTFAPLFWDDEDAGIGEYDCISIGNEELLLDNIDGLYHLAGLVIHLSTPF